jgi:ATP-dependent RNA helicase DeaD
MQSIMRFTKAKIRRERPPSEEEVEEKRANAFYDSLRQTLEEGKYERQDALIGRLLEQGYAATDIASALIHVFSPEPAAPVREERRDRPDRPAREPFNDRFDRFEKPRPQPREYNAYPESEGTGRKQDRTSGEVSHEPGMTRITLGVGREHNIQPGDILGVIVGVTKLPKEVVGVIRLQAKQAFVDVKDENADLIVKKLHGITFKGRKLWCKRASQAKPAANATEEKLPSS